MNLSLVIAAAALGTLPSPTAAEPAAGAAIVDAGVRGTSVEPRAAGTALRVGYAGSTPFVIDADPVTGISIGVWRAVALTAGEDFTLGPQPSVQAALDAVAQGELDVAIGPISITAERARHVRFTQPYFEARIGILASQRSASLWSSIAPFLTRVFAAASLVLALVLLGVGTAIWLLERRSNPGQFPTDPLRGIGNGVWFALVTMTTVGYGDRAPSTATGRVVAGLWMLIALVTTSSLTAGFASAFTVLQLGAPSIDDAGDLRGKPVAAITGTTGAAFAQRHGGRVLEVPRLQDAVRAVLEERAVAMVHDRPILQHLLSSSPDAAVELAAAAYEPQGYGFAVAADRGELLQRLNLSLLSAREDGRIGRITETWLGTNGR